MLIIKNRQINATTYDILNELKNYIMNRDGKEIFRDIRDVYTNTMVTCPFHKHGEERRPSCGINNEMVDGKIWVHCFTCGYKSTLEVFISKILGVIDDGTEGTKWILQNFDVTYTRKLDINIQNRNDNEKEQTEYVDEKLLEQYRYYHPYMYKRGLTNEIIERYDIGYDRVTDSITFPIRDITGRTLFIAKRSVVGKIFILPSSQNKPLYGVYELDYNKADIFICESFFNALTLAKWGYNAIALMGIGSNYQYDLINQLPFRTIYLCLDGDNAGRNGARKLCQYISPGKIVYEYLMPEGKDVNDLTFSEFQKIPCKLRDYN